MSTSHSSRLRTSALLALLLASGLARSQPAEVPAFQPFAGDTGYQEIALDADTWYVAFHGTRKHAMPAVEAAWLARAAQLCQSAGKRFIVELKYVGDRALASDKLASADDEVSPPLLKVAGPVYIPIFTPSGPREITPVLTPSKMAAIRCLGSSEGLSEGKVAVETQAALDAGRKAGLAIR